MTSETRDEPVGAHQKAKETLTAAGDAIAKMLEDIAAEAEQLLRSAELDAARHRTEVEEESARHLAESQAAADRLRAEAERARTEAEAIRRAAAAEASKIIAAAEAEAADIKAAATREGSRIVEAARAEHDRLATRVPELRQALSQFEAQVHALATEPVVDLTVIEAAEKVPSAPAEVEDTGVDTPVAAPPASPPPAPVAESPVMIDTIPLPDGSGTLPAARQLVDLDQYRAFKAPVRNAPPPEREVAVAHEADPAAQPVPADVAAAPLERLVGTHVASRGIPTDNDTIYQRRGGGLRRRIKAQGDE